VTWRSGVVGEEIVIFAAPIARRREYDLFVNELGGHRALLRRLEATWDEWAFVGAALVYRAGARKERVGPPPDDRGGAAQRRFVTSDPELVANVLCRVRSRLLLPDFPIRLEWFSLVRSCWSDDPRLVELARRAGAQQEVQ